MAQSWRLLQANEDEARCFPDLDTTLGLRSTQAAPPNSYREVRRIELPAGTWFLKIFHRTQLKNRLRFRSSPPFCSSDAEREMLVAQALLDRGIATARPVAVGRRGAASFYLCAELEGQPLRKLWAGGTRGRALLMAAAGFAGGLCARGVRLPDLSADHVWLQGTPATPRFAVLDLHNGAIGKGLPLKTAVRILRRFRKSIRGLAVPRTTAMGFAVALLRAAGLSAKDRRLVIRRTPPLDTFSRYDVPGRARGYRERNPARSAVEIALLRRAWPGRPEDPRLVLDCPTGVGRLHDFLEDDLGLQAIGADRALAMLREARQQTKDTWLLQADGSCLPLADQAVGGTVVFRLLHHLPPSDARQLLAEAARVASRYLVVSFFHPVSMHGLSRRLREMCTGSARTRHTISHRRLCGWLRELGFVPFRVVAQQRYLRDFWVASFRRG